MAERFIRSKTETRESSSPDDGQQAEKDALQGYVFDAQVEMKQASYLTLRIPQHRVQQL